MENEYDDIIQSLIKGKGVSKKQMEKIAEPIKDQDNIAEQIYGSGSFSSEPTDPFAKQFQKKILEAQKAKHNSSPTVSDLMKNIAEMQTDPEEPILSIEKATKTLKEVNLKEKRKSIHDCVNQLKEKDPLIYKRILDDINKPKPPFYNALLQDPSLRDGIEDNQVFQYLYRNGCVDKNGDLIEKALVELLEGKREDNKTDSKSKILSELIVNQPNIVSCGAGMIGPIQGSGIQEMLNELKNMEYSPGECVLASPAITIVFTPEDIIFKNKTLVLVLKKDKKRNFVLGSKDNFVLMNKPKDGISKDTMYALYYNGISFDYGENSFMVFTGEKINEPEQKDSDGTDAKNGDREAS